MTSKMIEKYIGSMIISAEMNRDEITLVLERHGDSPKKVAIYDGGGTCCEHRFMTTDDDLSTLVGHKLARIEVKDGPIEEEDYEVHETAFLEIGTDAGFVTVVNHNEHNGYYGGFDLAIKDDEDRQSI